MNKEVDDAVAQGTPRVDALKNYLREKYPGTLIGEDKELYYMEASELFAQECVALEAEIMDARSLAFNLTPDRTEEDASSDLCEQIDLLGKRYAAKVAELSAQVVGLQNTIRNARVQREAAEAHVEALQKALKSAQCPDPKCADGMITNTGPDPQHDQCEWCYGRHLLVDNFEDEAVAGSAPHDPRGDESLAAEGDEP